MNFTQFFVGLQGQFNYVNIVIRPLDHESNAVTLQAKEGRSCDNNYSIKFLECMNLLEDI